MQLCVIFLLQIGAIGIISGSPQLSVKMSASVKKVMYQESFTIQLGSGTQLLGDVSPRFEFRDNGSSHFALNLALHLTFPHQISFGDVTRDPRVAPFFKTAFSLMPMGELCDGPLKSKPLLLEKDSSGSFVFSRRFSTNGYAHLCTWSPLTERPGFGGIATIIEWQCRSAIIRGGILLTESKEDLKDDWTIPYHALPISSGGVGYISYNDTHIFLRPSITLKPALLLRFSYDRSTGIGVVMSSGLKVTLGDFIYSFQRIDIHQEPGAIRAKAFSTIDAPLQSTEMTGTYAKDGYRLVCKMSDRHWRPTAYAAMYQRRRLQLSGSISIPILTYDVTGKVRYEKRWNRSGSRGKSVVLSIGITGRIGDVTLSYKPALTVGSQVSYSGEIKLEKNMSSLDTVQVQLSHTMQVVKLSGVWLHRLDNSRLRLEWHTNGQVSVTYSIFPTK